ncbi:hypothetical protein JD844_026437 [Phrynosoma platyrhinos]|uniref:Uncharacterized protein n=1 Tax=Phrynosoma platyrhinos TaxID=52577 RepID=A0ABQ7SEU3_PHRPL|nr:hypothetical protein JD844_026437 [Phrynosoma platyrhinos]
MGGTRRKTLKAHSAKERESPKYSKAGLFCDSFKLRGRILSPNSDPLEPAQYTAATVRNMPENPENDVNRTVSANATSVAALKPTEPQYAVKTSGWQSSNQPGKISNSRFYLLI